MLKVVLYNYVWEGRRIIIMQVICLYSSMLNTFMIVSIWAINMNPGCVCTRHGHHDVKCLKTPNSNTYSSRLMSLSVSHQIPIYKTRCCLTHWLLCLSERQHSHAAALDRELLAFRRHIIGTTLAWRWCWESCHMFRRASVQLYTAWLDSSQASCFR